MTHDQKHKLKVALSTTLLVGATALAGNVTLPNVFTAGAPARAAQVNANFSAVKSAVDDNHSRIQTLEGQVPTLQSSLMGVQSNVTTLQSSVATAQSNITTLQSSVATAQSNISTLQSTVGTLNTSVATLNSTTWRRGGNLGTNPATDYLGTADNTQLDLRVNASSVMRLAPGQVGINTTTLPNGVEVALRGAGYANLYMAQADDPAGFLFSTGDASQNANDPRYHRASLYLDAYDPGFVQTRRLVIDEAGRVAFNRSDAFVGGQPVAFIVGSSPTTGNGAHLTLGGMWTSTSSRALKHAFAQVNTGAVLDKVAALQVSTWEYKNSPEGRHLGPVAEDFAEAFGLAGNGKFISANDLAGVSLAAVKGLNEKLERENAHLSEQLTRQQQQLSALEARLSKLER